ncbi:MAG: DUF808 domain-containing protein [Actinomycetaceae bacterium]|nr:DUF808 domain-containing protein [Arcanobacterium sp.]MDD7505493.1 DUF808 domain-containing protein [Actinomycetaceae bacterium]MDY6143474.1 DUF808 domain-containing protein [Arcanobacterium sp.]
MALGIAALLDDISALVKATAASIDDIAAAASRASVKATGVVVDDTAVTPQYLEGMAPKRELPVVLKIARGSIINKLIIIALILAMNQWLPWLLTPLLMLGGSYLCFEGAEKVLEWFGIGHHDLGAHTPAVDQGEDAEKKVVSGAIRTDFILSAEIMAISLNEIKDNSFWITLGALIVVAILITLLVYGVVALFVKIDDIGFHLLKQPRATSQRIGEILVKGMPKLMAVISVIGTLAMMWVGGHLFIQGLTDLGWPLIHDLIGHIVHPVEALATVGAAFGWILETACAMVFGFVWGCVILAAVRLIQKALSATTNHKTPQA